MLTVLTNKHKKLIRALKQKKQRDQHQLFVAEGPKVVAEFLAARYSLKHLFSVDSQLFPEHQTVLVNEQELSGLSYLTTANACLAVFSCADNKPLPASGLIVALDGVRDSGNLGTIIRLCDWFGITQLVCSNDTVDCYNPKVVQATMGSLARVNLTYTNLEGFLRETQLPVLGTFMDGGSVYKQTLPTEGVLVMGNEANGIRPAVE